MKKPPAVKGRLKAMDKKNGKRIEVWAVVGKYGGVVGAETAKARAEYSADNYSGKIVRCVGYVK